MSLFDQLEALSTEAVNPRTQDIDILPTRAIVALLHSEEHRVTQAIESQLDNIAAAVDLVVPVLSEGGSLIYVGAGTSGRLGILDASEMPPTFGTDPNMVRGIIAGGPEAVFRSIENAEDSEEEGAEAILAESLRARGSDGSLVVVGISASGRTPYVLGALKRADELGHKTVLISTNEAKVVRAEAPYVDVLICPHIGPEPITGSTRMNSGTAQKMVLNMITTAAMVRLGKTYGNVMVDLQLNNAKLVERARRMVMMICDVDYEGATAALAAAGGHVKTAIVMVAIGCTKEAAETSLADADGIIRNVLKGSS